MDGFWAAYSSAHTQNGQHFIHKANALTPNWDNIIPIWCDVCVKCNAGRFAAVQPSLINPWKNSDHLTIDSFKLSTDKIIIATTKKEKLKLIRCKSCIYIYIKWVCGQEVYYLGQTIECTTAWIKSVWLRETMLPFWIWNGNVLDANRWISFMHRLICNCPHTYHT